MDRKKLIILIEIAIMAALSVVLNQITLLRLPQGGNISLEMFPIYFIAFRRGLIPGLTTGVIFGLLNFALGGFWVNPIEVLMDYPLAFAGIGLAGLFYQTFQAAAEKQQKGRAISWLIAGGFLGLAVRWFWHFLSGILYFGQFAPAGQPVWFYSFWLNLLVVGPSALMAILVVIALYVLQPKLFTVE